MKLHRKLHFRKLWLPSDRNGVSAMAFPNRSLGTRWKLCLQSDRNGVSPAMAFPNRSLGTSWNRSLGTRWGQHPRNSYSAYFAGWLYRTILGTGIGNRRESGAPQPLYTPIITVQQSFCHQRPRFSEAQCVKSSRTTHYAPSGPNIFSG